MSNETQEHASLSSPICARDEIPAVRTGPRVWIGCLACYNDGRLVGEWYDAEDAATVTPSALHADAGEAVWGYCEELWVMDTDGVPVSREMSPREATEWGALLAEVDEWQRDALAAWVRSGDYIAQGLGDLPSLPDFEEQYMGEWESFEDYAAELFEDCGYGAEMPEHLASYFDMQAWARDLAYDYTVQPAPGGGVFVFRAL